MSSEYSPSIDSPRPFSRRCPQASGCEGTGALESYAVRWVDPDWAHHIISAPSETEALDTAREFVREGARCACVLMRLYGVRQ